jgi:xanthine dehydrogenase accessory factor
MVYRILVRGGGDLASGVIARLHRAGWRVLVTELDAPRAVRRYVSFGQAVYDGETRVEEINARRVEDPNGAEQAFTAGIVPVMVDPRADARGWFAPHIIIDGRMRKLSGDLPLDAALLVLGLGPGFTAGVDCHAVIETNRGPFLGRVIWQGQAQADTGIPEFVGTKGAERVLRAPASGMVHALVVIGVQVRAGEAVAEVEGMMVTAPFDGVLRGLVQSGLRVAAGEKIGDLDPRGDPRLSRLISDKALAIGGGVLEAILAAPALRRIRSQEGLRS